MDMHEMRRQVSRLRAALNAANDETGPMRTREADVHMYEAFGALARLEAETRAPVVAA